MKLKAAFVVMARAALFFISIRHRLVQFISDIWYNSLIFVIL